MNMNKKEFENINEIDLVKIDPKLITYELAKSIVSKRGLQLQFLGGRYQADLDIVMSAVKNNGLALKYVSEELKNNIDVVLIAVDRNGCALEYASEEMKKNHEVVELAFERNHRSINYIAENYNPRRGLINKIIDKYFFINFSKNVRNNPFLISKLIKRNQNFLIEIGDELKNDKIFLFKIKDSLLGMNLERDTLARELMQTIYAYEREDSLSIKILNSSKDKEFSNESVKRKI